MSTRRALLLLAIGLLIGTMCRDRADIRDLHRRVVALESQP